VVHRSHPALRRVLGHFNQGEAETPVRGLVNGFERERVLVRDASSRRGSDEPQRTYQEHVTLVEAVGDEAAHLVCQVLRDRSTQIPGRSQCADRRPHGAARVRVVARPGSAPNGTSVRLTQSALVRLPPTMSHRWQPLP